ncbi:MAG: hypothetical protein M3N13_01520 [Candidatus Eremiobacteraeota bacterium]|nr:hypothetical protein [Candidatus Eremiobacteraeota bacterium]
MRLRGERFFSRFTFTHPGLIRILKTAAGNLELPAKQRRVAFERLARLEGINDAQGRPIQRTDRDRGRANTLAMIARLSESPVVCSQEERRLFELLFEFPLPGGFDTLMMTPPVSTTVPRSLDPNELKDAFVVWAPADPAWRTALAVAALEPFHQRVIVVCREGKLANVRATFVRPDVARAALSRARAVMDLSVNDGGEAIALARLGLPLAVQYLSGAYEVLDGVAICRSWMQRDLELGALKALGLRAPRITQVRRQQPKLSKRLTRGPAVRMQGNEAGGADQTYGSIAKPGESAEYTVDIPHGAILFSTHIATLVEALERSGADRAQSDAIQKGSDGTCRLATGAFSVVRTRTTTGTTVTIPRATGFISS